MSARTMYVYYSRRLSRRLYTDLYIECGGVGRGSSVERVDNERVGRLTLAVQSSSERQPHLVSVIVGLQSEHGGLLGQLVALHGVLGVVEVDGGRQRQSRAPCSALTDLD